MHGIMHIMLCITFEVTLFAKCFHVIECHQLLLIALKSSSALKLLCVVLRFKEVHCD